MKSENDLQVPTLANLANLANSNIQAVKAAKAGKPNPTVESMAATQPPSWGWWGYQLEDGSLGSIRGPCTARASVQDALRHEFDSQVVRIVPLDGSKPLIDILKTDKRPGAHMERQQEAAWKQ